MSKNILYKDHTVEIGDCYLTIFKYYFPLATSKTIMFSDIVKVSLEDATGADHSWGICGKHLNNWFPLDKKRKNKGKFIAIYIKDKNIIPSFTPQDPDKVLNIIYENFTDEGRQAVEYRLSQVGKQTQIAQQQIMERMKEEEHFQAAQNTLQNLDKHEKITDQKVKTHVQKKQSVEMF